MTMMLLPLVAAGIVLQTEGHHAVAGGIKEFEMLADQVGTAQTEGGMVLAQGDEVLVVVEHLRIALLVAPVELVDAVGRLKRVVHALLVAQHLLAAEHEGHALRGEDGRLGQQVEADQLVFRPADG